MSQHIDRYGIRSSKTSCCRCYKSQPSGGMKRANCDRHLRLAFTTSPHQTGSSIHLHGPSSTAGYRPYYICHHIIRCTTARCAYGITQVDVVICELMLSTGWRHQLTKYPRINLLRVSARMSRPRRGQVCVCVLGYIVGVIWVSFG